MTEEPETIFKYKLEITARQVIQMPIGAKILMAQLQDNEVCLWAIVKSNKVITEGRIIRIIGTGHEFNDLNLKYISTVQLFNGSLVWHIFEGIP